MRRRRVREITKEQLVDCLTAMTGGMPPRDAEHITCEQFCQRFGISEFHVRRLWGCWAALRAELGMTRRAAPRPAYSDDDVLGRYHQCVEKLGRFPTIYEFEATGMSMSTLYRRIGPTAKIQAAYRAWLARQRVPESRGANVQVDANPPRDVAWLRRRWFELRVGFELRSSDFKGREADACDFLVVIQHDWPACPVRIIELHQALPLGEPRPEPLAEDQRPLFEPLW